MVFLKTFVAWLTSKIDAIFLREDMLVKWHDYHLFKTLSASDDVDQNDINEYDTVDDMDLDV